MSSASMCLLSRHRWVCHLGRVCGRRVQPGRGGGIGSLNRSTAAIVRDIDVVKGLTNRHYAVNHLPPALDQEFRHTLEARPAVISFALGDPGNLVRHDVGAVVMVQVTTVAQAVEAAERGADVIIAQGGEGGGYGGVVITVTLLPSAPGFWPSGSTHRGRVERGDPRSSVRGQRPSSLF